MRIIALVALLLIAACSSAPKNPGEVDIKHRYAEKQLEAGNKQADRGEIEDALNTLDEALNLAIALDDPSLRIRAGLSRGNVLFSKGRAQEAVEGWNKALAEAERVGNNELAAVSRIHIARGRLLSPEGKASAAQSVRDEVDRNMGQVKSDRLYTAFAWTVIGLAEKELGRYALAEAAIRRSLEIHEKDRYFELAAYDWFMIASFRSLSGDYRLARLALETAIAFDRRVENSWGLASDWRALGDVSQKAGDRAAARAAYLRAAEIFRAIENEDAAEEVLKKLNTNEQ
jgi:tetratricopeptide (TPR) repeat protein